MPTPIQQMRLLAAELADYTSSSITLLAELADDQDIEPARVSQTHALVDSYMNLAKACLDEFTEVARGA